jgi:hypothetical protein
MRERERVWCEWIQQARRVEKKRSVAALLLLVSLICNLGILLRQDIFDSNKYKQTYNTQYTYKDYYYYYDYYDTFK